MSEKPQFSWIIIVIFKIVGIVKLTNVEISNNKN